MCKQLSKSCKHKSLGWTKSRLKKDASHLIIWLHSYFLSSQWREPKAPWRTISKQGLGSINGKTENIPWTPQKSCTSCVTGLKQKKRNPSPTGELRCKELGLWAFPYNNLQIRDFFTSSDSMLTTTGLIYFTSITYLCQKPWLGLSTPLPSAQSPTPWFWCQALLPALVTHFPASSEPTAARWLPWPRPQPQPQPSSLFSACFLISPRTAPWALQLDK